MKHVLSVLLSLLLASSLFFSSCGNAAEDTAVPDTPQIAETKSPETEAETTSKRLDSLPEQVDLGGTEIRVVGYVEGTTNGNELSVEELNGEVINDAVYNRNLNVEKRLNVSIVPNVTPEWSASGEVRNMIQSGSDELDVYFANSCITFNVAAEGLFLDLFTVDNLDFSKPYWSQGFVDTASINGRLYLATGPMSLGFYRYLMIDIFNKNLFQRNGFDTLYGTVLEGKWTLEYQNSLASAFYIDLNGDGERDADDQYGFVTRAANDTSINDGYWASLNLHTIAKDENGYYILDLELDSFSSAVDRLLTLVQGNGTAGMCKNDDDIYKRFTEGRAAMSNARLHAVESGEFRDMEDDYGIVPMPKASEEQDRYYTLAQDQVIVYGLPITLPEERIGNIGLFLEAFASESFQTVKPAYYEIALTGKYVNDEESIQMLNLITDSLYIDPAILYIGMSPINVTTLRTILNSGQNTTASTIEKSMKMMNKFIEKINKAYGAEG